MAENTKIEWATHTFNPWWGCTRISRACNNCYAADLAKRTGSGNLWEGERRRTGASNWRLPYRWNNQAPLTGPRQRVFCASMADVFDNQVPPEWRRDLFAVIRETPNLDWLLLTKRPQNIRKMLPDDWGNGWRNVWLGASTENREEMLRRGAALKAVPAVVHFWSAEPLVEDLGAIPPDIMPDWIIAGGESGGNAVPTHPDWARSLRDQCAAAGVPFFFKQWGEWSAWRQFGATHWINTTPQRATYRGPCVGAFHGGEPHFSGPFETRHEGALIFAKKGKKAAGRLLDGVEHNGYPEVVENAETGRA